MARRVSHFYNERALTMKERAIRCLLAPRFSTSQLFPQKTYTVVRMYVFASFVLSAFIYVLHTDRQTMHRELWGVCCMGFDSTRLFKKASFLPFFKLCDRREKKKRAVEQPEVPLET